MGGQHLLCRLGAREERDGLRRPDRQPAASPRGGCPRGACGAGVQGRDLLRRHLRHRRLPYGDLRRPRRQPAHAAPPLRTVRRLVAGRRARGANASFRRVTGLTPQSRAPDLRDHAPPPGVRGHADPGFHRAAASFAKLVTRGRGGGALVVRLHGQTVLDLCTGWADRAHTRPWQPETLGLSFSTTKGIASTVIHRLAERGALGYDEPVATFWPEFAAGGKGRVTVRDLLTHRAGLWSVRAVAERPEDLLDHVAMEERLAARAVRAPTERSAYHAITYGWLVAGLARRVTGGRGLA